MSDEWILCAQTDCFVVVHSNVFAKCSIFLCKASRVREVWGELREMLNRIKWRINDFPFRIWMWSVLFPWSAYHLVFFLANFAVSRIRLKLETDWTFQNSDSYNGFYHESMSVSVIVCLRFLSHDKRRKTKQK